jgi:oligopeptide/dipeptide ABC transporter ATP-binding protein
VSLQLFPAEVVALVGESGSGKTTIARAICGTVPHLGTIVVGGLPVARTRRRDRRSLASRLQMVFQNPQSSLDPSMRIGDCVAEPLEVQGRLGKADREQRVRELLAMVGLDPALRHRFPRTLSGGQQQRVAIARAIALHPSVLVCDEAVSALDVTTQTQIVGLLKRLVTELGLSCLFITHDLALVPDIADRVVVLYAGRVAEEGPVKSVLGSPSHPYTTMLLAAVPVPDPAVQRSRRRGRIPTEQASRIASEISHGCAFHPRCPLAMDICRTVDPVPVSVGPGHAASCHLLTQAAEAEGLPVGAGVDASSPAPSGGEG